MFQLYDKTRRRVCIAGFLVLGVLPALLVGGWCLSRRVPGYVQAEAQQLSRQLGLDVKLGGLKHLRPGAVLYEQLAVTDPETGAMIFRCRLLEIVRGQQSDSQGQRRATLVMTASQPEVEAASLDRIWQCLQRTLAGSCGPLEADLQFSAAELTLRASCPHPNPLPKGEGTPLAHNSQTLTEVQGAIEDLPGRTQAQLQFRLAGADTPKPARIRIVRNRQVAPPASGFELDTGDGELPCNVLAMGLDELKPLGPRCRFRGYIGANETPDGWQGEVTGQLIELDLGGLITDHFPHKVIGSGEVTIQSARFRGGRLEEGSALILAGPGTMDRSLMASAIERLGLVAGTEPLSASERVPYEQLAFSATLDAQGLRLHGLCTAGEPGTILSDGRRRLLGESLEQPSPTVALVQTLVPQSAVQVPASRQTDWLLRHLRVPEVMSPPGTEAIPPHGRVRPGDTWQR
jgi:hypothetical protein